MTASGPLPSYVYRVGKKSLDTLEAHATLN